MKSFVARKPFLSNFLGLDTAGLYGVLLAIYWTASNLVYFMRGVVSRLLGEDIAQIFIPSIYVIFGLLSLPWIVKRIKLYDLLVFGIIVIYFFFCYSLFPANSRFLDAIKVSFLCYSLPALFVGLALDVERCDRILYVTSIVAVLIVTLSTMMGGGTLGEGEDEDMTRSYSMLAPTLVVFFHYYRFRKPFDLFVSFIGFFLIFALGARGPLACVILFFVLYFMIFREYKHPVFVRSIMVILFFIVILFFNYIINALSALSANLGLSTRILEFAGYGLQDQSLGREIIYANVFEQAVHGPFWGSGFCADRVFSNFYDTDTYAHNVVLELWVEFGIVPGSVIIGLILLFMILAIKNIGSYEGRVFMLIMFVSGICSLLFSSSYLVSSMFFITVGLFISYARNGSHVKRLNNNVKD